MSADQVEELMHTPHQVRLNAHLYETALQFLAVVANGNAPALQVQACWTTPHCGSSTNQIEIQFLTQ